MGLLTKAFFLPINFGLIIFLLIRIWVNKRESSKQFWSLLQIIIPAALIGGGWYLYNFLTIGEFTGSAEAVSLANQSGFISGLKEHFSIYGLTQGGITIFVSYVWAGTWSLVRLPTFLQLPLLILFACILISYGWQLKRCYLNDPKWVMVSILIFFIASLFWHVLVGLAINGRGATPGWYLHILMPWIAPAVGGGITYFLRYKTTRRLTVLLCVYAILYHMAALWSYFALFTGCAGKGDNTNFVFTGKFFCFDQIPLLIQRSSVFGYPLLAAFGLLGWLFANLWLFKQIRNSDITFDFNSTP
jgi:hypothetical protein